MRWPTGRVGALRGIAVEQMRRNAAVRDYVVAVFGFYDSQAHLGIVRDNIIALLDGGEL